jgi:DNA-binding XRE family transcriptional regulator
MNSWFLSNEEFFEGEVFMPTEEEFLRIRSPRRGRNTSLWLRQSGIAATSRKVLVGVAVGAAALLATSFIAPANASMTPAWKIEAEVPPESAPDPGVFAAARKSLGLSQREAAAILHVSEWALEQFEQDRVEPGRAFAARYSALVQLEALLTEAFGQDDELRRAYLHGHGAFFGGRSPLEWAAESGRPDAIREITAVYSRALS